MFSGIVEVTSKIVSLKEYSGSPKLILERPKIFNDLEIGDSIAVNGVCLTLESFDEQSMQFALGSETLQLTTFGQMQNIDECNLERSLQFADRVHGHLVSGHVDGTGRVYFINPQPGSTEIIFSLSANWKKFFWKKGSIAINGVSLTINQVDVGEENLLISCVLIPETLKRTNLSMLAEGDMINFEVDQFARAIAHMESLK